MPSQVAAGYCRAGNDSSSADSAKFVFSRAVGVFSGIAKDATVIDPTKWVFSRSLASFSLCGKDSTNLNLVKTIALKAGGDCGADSCKINILAHRALGVNALVGQDSTELVTLIREILALPPKGQIFVATPDGEVPLNGYAIHRNDSNILNIYLEGDRIVPLAIASAGRLAGMNLTFTAKLHPNDPDDKAVIVKSLKKSQMFFLGAREIVNYQGTTKKVQYQCVLLPKDTESITKTTILYYDLQLDNGLQNSEKYTLEGKRGEKFTIGYDLYRS